MAHNEQLERRMAGLETFKDEIAVRFHLAEMNVRDRWGALRPKIERIAADVEHAGEAAVRAVTRRIEAMRHPKHPGETTPPVPH